MVHNHGSMCLHSSKVLVATRQWATNLSACGGGSDYRKRRAVLGHIVLLVALAFFYLIGWAVSNAKVVASPYLTYPLTLLGTLFIMRFG